MTPFRRIITHPSSLLLSSTAVNLCLGILSATVQARVLGPSGRGELATAMVPGTMIAMLLCIGLPDYFARRAAQGAAISVLSKTALVLSLGIGAISLVPYLLLAQFQAPVGSDAWWLLVAYAVSVPLFVYGYCLVGLMAGSAWWRWIAWLRIVPLAISVTAILTLFFVSSNPTPLMVGLILIGFAAVGPLAVLKNRSMRPSGKLTRQMFGRALSFGLRGWPAGAIALLNQRVDLLMMTFIASTHDLGLYAVSTTLAAVLIAIANSIAMPIRNKVTQGDVAVVAPTAALTMFAVLLLALVVIAVLPTLVHVLLGDRYLPAIPVMTVLLLAQVPLAGAVILTQSLIGVGKPGSPIIGESLALVTTVVLVLVLFPSTGIVGAAIATGVGNLLSLGALVFLARRHINRDALWRYFVPTLGALIQVVRNRKTVSSSQ